MLAASPALADTGGLSAYLKARAADANGDASTATTAYARALAAEPDSSLIAIRAYREGLEAGDLALVRRAAGVLTAAGVAPVDAPLLPLGDAARTNDLAAVDAAIARLRSGPLRLLVPSLGGWLAAARSADPDPALNTAEGGDALARRLASETRSLLLVARRDTDKGIAAIRAIQGTERDLDLRLAAAQLLAGQGRVAEARAMLPGRGPIESGFRIGVPAKPTLAFGVSRLLTRVAADLGDDAATPLLVALTRAALAADPGYDRARLILVSALARDGGPATALAELDKVDRAGPLAGLAAATRISILNGAGRAAEALPAARVQAEAPTAVVNDWQRYADLLYAAGRFDEAARWYRRGVDADPGGWSGWMQYGGALDRAGRWDAARPALEKAVALAPTEPLALNYLGYARLARGERVAASARLLEQASALDPGNAAVTDSLGWAYYLTGRTAQALPLVEKAAAAEPADAEIGEHLGDIYWTLGRRYEARYAWRAAAGVASGEVATRLADKLSTGLPIRR